MDWTFDLSDWRKIDQCSDFGNWFLIFGAGDLSQVLDISEFWLSVKLCWPYQTTNLNLFSRPSPIYRSRLCGRFLQYPQFDGEERYKKLALLLFLWQTTWTSIIALILQVLNFFRAITIFFCVCVCLSWTSIKCFDRPCHLSLWYLGISLRRLVNQEEFTKSYYGPPHASKVLYFPIKSK